MIKEAITVAVIATDPLVVIPTLRDVIDGGEPTEVPDHESADQKMTAK